MELWSPGVLDGYAASSAPIIVTKRARARAMAAGNLFLEAHLADRGRLDIVRLCENVNKADSFMRKSSKNGTQTSSYRKELSTTNDQAIDCALSVCVAYRL